VPNHEHFDPDRVQLALTVGYPAFRLELKLDLPGTGVIALFGRSGSGKTTALRLLAGLERGQGSAWVLGACWQDSARGVFVPTHERRVGYVFQEASLFPHLTVRGNLDYAVRRRRRDAGAPRADVARDPVVALLGIGPLLARAPDRLSGGERQRVAIARALLAAPRMLLMDEPLAALDAIHKAEFFPYLARLRGELSIPILYVTHALEEAARLADHLVLLDQGRVVASGAAGEMFARVDLSSAFADEAGVVIDGVVGAQDAPFHLTRLDFDGGWLWVGGVDLPRGTTLRARVLARDVSLVLGPSPPSSILNIIEARVVEIADDGPDRVMVRLSLGAGAAGRVPLLARITRRSREVLELRPGLAVRAQVKSVALMA
jgi:molybdate transport system ATP-binding protein